MVKQAVVGLVEEEGPRFDSGGALERAEFPGLVFGVNEFDRLEAAQFVVDSAVQLHGARALRRGHLLEHLYREVRAPRIYEGATEVQRAVIAKDLYRAGPKEEAG